MISLYRARLANLSMAHQRSVRKRQLLICNYPVDKVSEQYQLFLLFTSYC